MIERYTSKPRLVHPVYCVEEGRWYAEDGTSAKSLASLQIKMPGVKIADYYPDGYGDTVRSKPTRMIHDPWAEPLPVFKEKIREELTSIPGVWSRNGFELEKPREVKEEEPVAVTEPVKFRKVVPRVKALVQKRDDREHGAPRRVVDWKDPESIKKLERLMLVEKLHVNDVANEFGCTRNAVIGACHRTGISITDRKKVAPYVENRPPQLLDKELGSVPHNRRRA